MWCSTTTQHTRPISPKNAYCASWQAARCLWLAGNQNDRKLRLCLVIGNLHDYILPGHGCRPASPCLKQPSRLALHHHHSPAASILGRVNLWQVCHISLPELEFDNLLHFFNISLLAQCVERIHSTILCYHTSLRTASMLMWGCNCNHKVAHSNPLLNKKNIIDYINFW